MRTLISDDQTRPRLFFRLPLDPARLLRARHRIRDYLHERGVEPDVIDEVVLAVEEGMTNAMRHSGGKSVDVSVEVHGRDLAMAVRDHGRGFDVSGFDPERVPDLLVPSGRGLFLIARLMDELHLENNGGLLVRAAKRDVVTVEKGAEARLGGAVPGARVHSSVREQALLNEIEEAFFALDWEYRYVYVNVAAERMWDITREAHQGRILWEVQPRLPEPAVRAIRDAMELGNPSLLEAQPAESAGWREYRVYPTSFGIAAYVHDIDKRKRKELERDDLLKAFRESEERFRSLFDAMLEGVVLHDLVYRAGAPAASSAEGTEQGDRVGRGSTGDSWTARRTRRKDVRSRAAVGVRPPPRRAASRVDEQGCPSR